MKLKYTYLLLFLLGIVATPLSFCDTALTYISQLGANKTSRLYDITANEILPSQATLETLKEDGKGPNSTFAAYSYSFPMETINVHLGDSLSLNAVASCVINPEDVANIDTTAHGCSNITKDGNGNTIVQLTPTWQDTTAFSEDLSVSEPTSWIDENFPNNNFVNATAMPLYFLRIAEIEDPNQPWILATRLIPTMYQIPPGKSYTDSYPGAYTGTVVFKAHYDHPTWWVGKTWIPQKTITITVPIQMTTYAEGDTSVSFPIGTP